jgi:hypothetical protein
VVNKSLEVTWKTLARFLATSVPRYVFYKTPHMKKVQIENALQICCFGFQP